MDEIMLLERGLGLQIRVWPDLKARVDVLALSGALYVMIRHNRSACSQATLRQSVTTDALNCKVCIVFSTYILFKSHIIARYV